MRCIDKSKCFDYALLLRATQMMQGDEDAACHWMQASNEIFDGDSPLVHAVSDTGREEVYQYIERVQHEQR